MPVKNLAVDVVTPGPDTAVRDLARTMLDEDLGDLSGLAAEDVMTPDPVTIYEDATTLDLPATMADGRVRRIPVVDDEGAVVGIVTLDDVVATVGEMLDDVATVIQEQSREYAPDA
jgi:CBS domain-containing protein